jgi:hypothetical protein
MSPSADKGKCEGSDIQEQNTKKWKSLVALAVLRVRGGALRSLNIGVAHSGMDGVHVMLVL